MERKAFLPGLSVASTMSFALGQSLSGAVGSGAIFLTIMVQFIKLFV